MLYQTVGIKNKKWQALVILIIMIVRHRTLEKGKILGIFSFMLVSLAVFTDQIINPEILLTSIVPTVINYFGFLFEL